MCGKVGASIRDKITRVCICLGGVLAGGYFSYKGILRGCILWFFFFMSMETVANFKA